jgi:hypothetical protein
VARSDQVQARDARLKRLAKSIDALADKDQHRLNRAREIADTRRKAATELHAICSGFVLAVNRLLSCGKVFLDPQDFPEEAFREEDGNLIQINASGRILQIHFSATKELISTEEFRIPYTIEGTVRAYNQDLLDKDVIEEQLLFYTFEKGKKMWRFFDARTYRSGPFDQEYLVNLMEQLI